MPDETLFMKYYVQDVRQITDGLRFVVVETERRKRHFHVRRVQWVLSDASSQWIEPGTLYHWLCDCDEAAGRTCDHVRRAILYFSNMQEFPESDRVETPVIILNNQPRRIKVG